MLMQGEVHRGHACSDTVDMDCLPDSPRNGSSVCRKKDATNIVLLEKTHEHFSSLKKQSLQTRFLCSRRMTVHDEWGSNNPRKDDVIGAPEK